MRYLLCALVVLGLAGIGLGQPGADPLAGNWTISILEDGQSMTFWILHLEKADGKLTGSVVSLGTVPPSKLVDPKTNGDLVSFELQLEKGPTFSVEGKIPKATDTRMYASLARGGQMIPSVFVRTAAKTANELNREILTRSGDPRVFQAALELVKRSTEDASTPAEVKGWVDTALRAAEGYGPRWQTEQTLKMIDVLQGQKALANLAVDTARAAEKIQPASTSAEAKLRLLTSLGTALDKAGQADQSKEVAARIEKLEGQAYADYAKTSLDFKLEKSTGRKGDSKRAVLVELFTGAQCPPCVAADLAFDAVERTYPESEAVLLQYHLHVPGPDALTNPDTEKRADFYGKLVRGTPTTLFDGKVDVEAGGSRDEAEETFMDFRKALAKHLETKPQATVAVTAARKAEKINIKATVQGLEKPGEKTKLRLALVEDWVRYSGRNGIGYHHNVVRFMPGGPDGFTLSKKDSDQSIVVDVADVRRNLEKYLDDTAKMDGPFLDAQRPMRFRDFHVVAFVQDDATGEILQAASVAVKE